MQIDQILSAGSANLWSILGDRGRGFYVPLYQRRYRWTPAMIDRLLQDMLLGLDRLIRDNQAITFVGTLISSVKDPTEDLGREPSGALAIIDGQQRLTTFTLLSVACHDEIRTRSSVANQEADYSNWLHGQLDLVMQDLMDCIVEDTRQRTDPLLRFRPRIVRAVDDKWGTSPDEARYSSPLPALALDYVSWINDGTTPFVFSPDDHAEENSDFADQYKLFQRRYRDDIRSPIRKAVDGREGGPVFPEWFRLKGSNSWLSGLFESDAPSSGVANELLQACTKDPALGALVRMLVFSRFLLDRVVMTLVEAQREDYALDMFDSLNSTGEPLTAIETFKPRVIQGEGGPARYRLSVAKQHFDAIEQYLASEEGQAQADNAKSIVTTFALAETGEKIGSKLSEQRNYLRHAYSEISDEENQRQAMTRQLERTSALSLLVWSRTPHIKDHRLHGELRFMEDAIFYLDVLRRSQHEITMALLSRYYDTLITSRSEEERERFTNVARVLLGFWVLWRSSADGTRGIDAVHRDIMGRGIPPDVEPDEQSLPRLAHRFSNELPSSDELSAVLRGMLRTRRQITDSTSYVNRAESIPIGKARNLARFLILAAHHGQTTDEEQHGLTVPGRDSPESQTLSLAGWTDDRYSTLEHVAPQQPNEDDEVDTEIYVSDRYELLGNLTALPLDLNASLGNRSWDRKRVTYRALCANDSVTAHDLMAGSAFEFSQEAIDRIADESAVIPTLRPIVGVDEWNLDLIQRRTRHMLGVVWNNVSPWLGF
jgi:hypothetical protein